jgi:predicted nucleotidyltransferase component of viral defense system
MIVPKPADTIHKAWLYRILSAIADNIFLVSNLRFKGGTCAAMQNIIERFSIDLDFDLIDEKKMPQVRKALEIIFKRLDLEIKEQSQHVPQYFLKYRNKTGERSILRLDVTFPPPKANEYEAVRFIEIDRIIYCQTIPTMFANKLVAVLDRYEKHGSIAGRDLFDIHTFFIRGDKYKKKIIEERRNKNVPLFLEELQDFIEKKITQTNIDQDLNALMPAEKFKKLRKILKPEVLLFLEDERKRLSQQPPTNY